MPEHYVVTYDDVIEAHDAALENGGGIVGIKDEALIFSTLGRPYQEFTGFIPYPTVIDKAGCLLHGFLNNHGSMTQANERHGKLQFSSSFSSKKTFHTANAVHAQSRLEPAFSLS
ncbi:MAG: hypothetical protein L3J30_04280 [Marinosulfonomonas sp.]|nr:hypothetical protein [Marinosulfonomonas sp.]